MHDVRVYNENFPDRPYITGIFKKYRNDQSFLNRQQRDVQLDEGYRNVKNAKLQPNTEYDILIHVHEYEVYYRYFQHT